MKSTCHQIPNTVILLMLLLVFSHCKKDQAMEPEDFILGEWRFTQVYMDEVSVLTTGVPVNDEFPNWPPCSKDNYVIFRADSTGEQNEGASTCSPTDPQILPFRWYIFNNGKEISFHPGLTFDNLQLDERHLKLRTEMLDQISADYVETIYLERR